MKTEWSMADRSVVNVPEYHALHDFPDGFEGRWQRKVASITFENGWPVIQFHYSRSMTEVRGFENLAEAMKYAEDNYLSMMAEEALLRSGVD